MTVWTAQKERDALSKGHALQDPKDLNNVVLPIEDSSDLKDAITTAHFVKNISQGKVHKHICKQASRLGLLHKVPAFMGGTKPKKVRHHAMTNNSRAAHGNEERSYKSKLEIRGNKGQPHTVTVEAIASGPGKYDVRDDLGVFKEEIIWPGALTGTKTSDTKMCLQHDYNQLPLGSTRAGTMRVADTSDGLAVEWDADSRSSVHADTLLAIERGDLDRLSIGFVCGRDKWDVPEYQNRVIYQLADLREASFVSWPSNDNTSISISDRDAGTEEVARILAIATNERRSGKRLSKSTVAALQKIKSAHIKGTKKLNKSVSASIDSLLLPEGEFDDGAIGGGSNGGDSWGPGGVKDGTGSRDDDLDPELRRWIKKQVKRAQRERDESIAQAVAVARERRPVDVTT